MFKETKLLPLGTAVKVKIDDSIYVIMARTFIKDEDGKFIAMYRGVPHPFGESKTYQIVTFSEQEIVAIKYLGYEDELDTAFMKERIEGAAEVKLVQEDDENEDEEEIELDLPEIIEDETFETLMSQDETSEYPYDPFYKLRNRGR